VKELTTYNDEAMKHIRHLSVTIGSRGSCTTSERTAAEYLARQMGEMGIQDGRVETFSGVPSTYRPFALAFTAALIGTFIVWLDASPPVMALATLLNLLGAWGMLAETNTSGNWMQWLLPKATGHNAIGLIHPIGEVSNRVILCAHLDTHRTPIFFSSKAWQALFSILVGGTFVSMAVCTIFYGLGAASGWEWVKWIGLAMSAFELFALAMCIHADLTPFSPGASDDASGVGVSMGIAKRMAEEPLKQSEVWLVFTDCEEVGAYGITAFLDGHAGEWGSETFYIILDQVGTGQLKVLTRDGLIIKHSTHPSSLEISRRADAALPDVEVNEMEGAFYTDAIVATKRGLSALSVDSVESPHWHQMSDTVENVNPKFLENSHLFVWQILQDIDSY